jgi:Putative bacterial sensory transduction regulator
MNMRRLGLVVVGVLMVATPAMARPIPTGGVNADEVAAALRDKGYKAEITKDSGGDPKVESAADGSKFDVWFYGCKNGRCASVQFASAFDLKNGLSLADINAWNRKNRFGKGHLDDEMDPFLQYDVDFEVGATSEAIGNAIDVWVAVLPSFKTHIDFK